MKKAGKILPFCVHNKVFAVHLLKLSHAKLKFSPAFFKRRREPSAATVALRRVRNLVSALFFFVAFSFAPAYAKEKADKASDFLFWLLTEIWFIS